MAMEKTAALIQLLNQGIPEGQDIDSWKSNAQTLFESGLEEFSETDNPAEYLAMALSLSVAPEVSAVLGANIGDGKTSEDFMNGVDAMLKAELRDPDELKAPVQSFLQNSGRTMDYMLERLAQSQRESAFFVSLNVMLNGTPSTSTPAPAPTGEAREELIDEIEDYVTKTMAQINVAKTVQVERSSAGISIGSSNRHQFRAVGEKVPGFEEYPVHSHAEALGNVSLSDIPGYRESIRNPDYTDGSDGEPEMRPMPLYVGGANPTEMKNALIDQFTKDIISGDFPIPPALDRSAFDDEDALKAAALARAKVVVGQMEANGLFGDVSRVVGWNGTAQVVSFFPTEETMKRVATNLTPDEVAPKAPSGDLHEDFFAQLFIAQRDEHYSLDTIDTDMFDRMARMVANGEISISSRQSGNEMDVLKKIFEDAYEDMQKGDLNGNYMGTGGRWETDKFEEIMREKIAEAGIHIQYGYEPFEFKDVKLQTPRNEDAVEYGAKISANVSEGDPWSFVDENGDALFRLDSGFQVFKAEGSGMLFHWTPIEVGDNGMPVGSIRTPEDLDALIGEGPITITPISARDADTNAENAVPLGYRIETQNGNSFEISFDALPESNVTENFQEKRAVGLDTVGIVGMGAAAPDIQANDPPVIGGEQETPPVSAWAGAEMSP